MPQVAVGLEVERQAIEGEAEAAQVTIIQGWPTPAAGCF